MLAVITGGTRGIGLGIARRLLEEGFCVLLTSRTPGSSLAQLTEQYPGKVDFFACDISDIGQIDALKEYVQEKYGKLDVPVNDAGTAPRVRKDMLEITPEDFDFVLDINLKGTFFVTQKLSSLLMKNEKARIINISSMSAYTASVNRAEYCVSKAGISMLTKLFAIRLAEHKIAVLEIRPGIIDTDMTAGVKEKYETLIAGGITPIDRMGTPDDIGKCVCAIARGDFDFCTGSVIDCDGGFSVRSL